MHKLLMRWTIWNRQRNALWWLPQDSFVYYKDITKHCFFFTFLCYVTMDVSTFLKSHFWEDGSYWNVVWVLLMNYCKHDYNLYWHMTNRVLWYDAEWDILWYEKICDRIDWKDLYSQSPETQRKIAELLDWRE